VVSQLSLAIPMCFLYEIGIFFARLVERRRKVASPASGAPPASG
jgi:Sec-independent protein secretion pathway component TatC